MNTNLCTNNILVNCIVKGGDSSGQLGREILVLAGTSLVHAETILHLRTLFKCYNTPLLNELRGGDLHGFTREEIKASINISVCVIYDK